MWEKLHFYLIENYEFYVCLQTAGEGESLTIFLENTDSAKDIWGLPDSWSDEAIWSEGRVEIKATELSEDSVYRVSLVLERKTPVKICSDF